MNMDCLVFALLRFMIVSGDSFHPLNYSDSNLQQITTWSPAFFRASSS